MPIRSSSIGFCSNIVGVFQQPARLNEAPALKIAEFSTWPLLHEFAVERPGRGNPETVKPDGFIRIHESAADGSVFEHTLFVEVDRSEEVQEKLIGKAERYLLYYKSGDFAVRNGATRDDFRQYPFRVLMVLKSAERRNNTAERLLQIHPPILTMVWLTTFAEVTSNPFGTIWIRPADYRDATQGTTFDPERKVPSYVYRRNAQREAFIESKIQKRSLLED